MLCPFIQVIDEEVEQDWAEYRPLGITTNYRPPTRLNYASLDTYKLLMNVYEVLNTLFKSDVKNL